MIPGSNLLNMASRLIGLQSITWFKATGRTTDSVGRYVTTYDAGTEVRASVQPVSRSVYEQYGLDLQKTYYTIFTTDDMGDLKRDGSPDKLVYNGVNLQAESNQGDWFSVDGWSPILAVKIDD